MHKEWQLLVNWTELRLKCFICLKLLFKKLFFFEVLFCFYFIFLNFRLYCIINCYVFQKFLLFLVYLEEKLNHNRILSNFCVQLRDFLINFFKMLSIIFNWFNILFLLVFNQPNLLLLLLFSLILLIIIIIAI